MRTESTVKVKLEVKEVLKQLGLCGVRWESVRGSEAEVKADVRIGRRS
ncbi:MULTISPECIES: hypothetical protein [Paenibacillus]|nr:hypothetical protein [Paenibacillus caseinilyticus]MCZ8519292.1 hypothetical protein [Paenibacillus caseinilyticus]